MSKVKVSKKDLLRVISQADERTQWNTSSWKARQRLLDAVSEGSEEVKDTKSSADELANKWAELRAKYGGETRRELLDYCAIPGCGCPGDVSHA